MQGALQVWGAQTSHGRIGALCAVYVCLREGDWEVRVDATCRLYHRLLLVEQGFLAASPALILFSTTV